MRKARTADSSAVVLGLGGRLVWRLLFAAALGFVAVLLLTRPTMALAAYASAAGTPISTSEGSAFSGPVGTYSTDGYPYSASIAWGDGTSSGASISGGVLYGAHNYLEEGSYTTQVVVYIEWTYSYCAYWNLFGCQYYETGYSYGSASGSAAATVVDATLSPHGTNLALTATAGATVSGTVGSFTDANPAGTAAELSAVIKWGDGHTSAGTVVTNLGGWFDVFGANTYAQSGVYPVAIVVSDVGGASLAIGATTGVRPAPLVATVNGSQVFGGSPAYSATYSGLINGDTAAVVTGTIACSTSATAASPAGSSYPITSCSGLSATNYTISYVYGALTVTPAALTATVTGSNVYGGSPAYLPTFSGFVNGDSAAVVTGSLACSTTALPTSHVGTGYSISGCSGLLAGNYAITYAYAGFSVTPAPLTVTADSKNKPYGGALPGLTVSFAGFVNRDTPASLATAPALTTSATAASHVAAYAITAAGAVDPDYTIGYAAGTLTVTPAGLTISADSKSKVYGAALPTLTASYTGLVNGDTAASMTTAPTLSSTASQTSHVGGNPYLVIASGAVDTDYSIGYVTGTLTVTPAGLTITADSKVKVYGAAMPTLTASYAGLVNGDTPLSLTTPPALTTPANAASQVAGNPYAISAGGAVDSDYTISYGAGTLTITKANTTAVIASSSSSSVYGSLVTFTATLTADAPSSINPTSQGTVNFSDDASALCSSVVASGQANCALNGLTAAASPHSITAVYSGNGDYNVSPASSPLIQMVTPAPLTVTTNSVAKVYGQANPAFTASSSGFVLGQDPSYLGGTLSFSTVATVGSHVGSYSVAPSGLTSPNYNLTFVAGILTIGPAGTTTALASSGSPSVYGQPVTFTATVTANGPSTINPTIQGWVTFSDVAAVLCGSVPLASGQATCSLAGLAPYPTTHSVTAAFAGASDYSGSASGSIPQFVKRAASIAYVGDYYVPYTTAARLAVQVNQGASIPFLDYANPSNPVLAQFVVSTSTGSQAALVCTQITDGSAWSTTGLGVAATTAEGLLPQGPYVVTVSLVDVCGMTPTASAFEFAEPAVVDVTSTPTSGSFVTGGGFITPDSTSNAGNRNGNFGFVFKWNSSGTNLQGNLVYVYRLDLDIVTGAVCTTPAASPNCRDVDVRVKSNSLAALSTTPQSTTSTSGVATGKFSVQFLDALGGQDYAQFDFGNGSFQLNVLDGGLGGSADTFALALRNPDGTVFHLSTGPYNSVTGSAQEVLIGGGNVTVHT